MPGPLKPLIDAALPDTTQAGPILSKDGQTLGWHVISAADVDGATVALEGYGATVGAAVAQAMSQLNAARGVDILIVHD